MKLNYNNLKYKKFEAKNKIFQTTIDPYIMSKEQTTKTSHK